MTPQGSAWSQGPAQLPAPITGVGPGAQRTGTGTGEGVCLPRGVSSRPSSPSKGLQQPRCGLQGWTLRPAGAHPTPRLSSTLPRPQWLVGPAELCRDGHPWGQPQGLTLSILSGQDSSKDVSSPGPQVAPGQGAGGPGSMQEDSWVLCPPPTHPRSPRQARFPRPGHPIQTSALCALRAGLGVECTSRGPIPSPPCSRDLSPQEAQESSSGERPERAAQESRPCSQPWAIHLPGKKSRKFADKYESHNSLQISRSPRQTPELLPRHRQHQIHCCPSQSGTPGKDGRWGRAGTAGWGPGRLPSAGSSPSAAWSAGLPAGLTLPHHGLPVCLRSQRELLPGRHRRGGLFPEILFFLF